MMRQRAFRTFAAMLLAAVFFASQAFACCMANQKLGHALASVFAPHSVPSEHACCAKAAAAVPSGKNGCSKQECCIQDASHRAPQIASEAAPLPILSAVVALLPAPRALLPVSAWAPAPVTDTGPPLYLRTLRLLV